MAKGGLVSEEDSALCGLSMIFNTSDRQSCNDAHTLINLGLGTYASDLEF